jgi:hypothetical protein
MSYETACACRFLARGQIVFLVWVTFDKRKWVILAERRGPRIASRNLFDMAVGHDNLFRGDKYKWCARLFYSIQEAKLRPALAHLSACIAC